MITNKKIKTYFPMPNKQFIIASGSILAGEKIGIVGLPVRYSYSLKSFLSYAPISKTSEYDNGIFIPVVTKNFPKHPVWIKLENYSFIQWIIETIILFLNIPRKIHP